MSGLFLNFFHLDIPAPVPIDFPTLPYAAYATKEAFKKLNGDHADWTFYRIDDLIYLWPKNNQAVLPQGTATLPVVITEKPKLLAKIFEMALIDLIATNGSYNFFKNKHANVWEIIAKKDLLKGAIPGLTVNRVVHFSTTFFYKEDRLFFGFTLSAALKNAFTWSREEFAEAGIDAAGLRGNEEKIYANLQSLKRFLDSSGASSTYDKVTTQENLNSKAFQVIDGFQQWLQKKRGSIVLPFGLNVNSISRNYLPFDNDVVRSEIIGKPQRYFYSNRKNTEGLRFYDQMVKTYQPYSLELYQNKAIKIGVICPAAYQGETEGFIKKIEMKLKEVFHFNALSFLFKTIPGTDLDSYKERLYEDDLLKCDLIYVIVNEAQEKLHPNFSPYYVCKAKLIGNGIPTQDVQIETIRQNLNAFTMTNIALNTYAKLGGTAWTIEKEDRLKDELVIGIGSTISDNGQFVLGIAQVFHNDGRYMTGDCSPLSTFATYPANLENHLFKTLSPLIEEMSKTGKFRLIFHLFKSASEEYEIKAIEKLKARLSEYDFEFALVHLGYGHNYRLYYNDGKSDINQGTYVQLSRHSAVLHFVPKSDLPLKIDLDKRSDFTSLFYIAKQVYWFSHLSHRSYMPSKRTVTIMYPSLMARMTEELKKVEGWDFDRLKAVSDKLWFI
ncbi:Piwi domain-containing protein [Mucilaginibacter flavus]|uniref:Piwi domain-containing protein n=1 Tax=Mucilaginibacter flavus TaxID=931504 RepID=UPI0025B435AC|nr:Piwi domain-containing protein [Mucilaginibacter flavus]MDN3584661.1 Piwi domain-containing protein [Mucilaginibacter flavus]